MTPEVRAEQLLTGVHSIDLKVTHLAVPRGNWFDAVTVDGYVPVLRALIAAAIREAVAEEREACARRVGPDDIPGLVGTEQYAVRWRLAAAIRARATAADTPPPPAPAAPAASAS